MLIENWKKIVAVACVLTIPSIACALGDPSKAAPQTVSQAGLAVAAATTVMRPTATPETSVNKGPAVVPIETKTTYVSGPDSKIDLPCNQAMKNLHLIDPESNPNLTFEYPLVVIQSQDNFKSPICIVLFKAKDKNSDSKPQYYATLSSGNTSIVTEPIIENPFYDKSMQKDKNTIQGVEIRSRHNTNSLLLILKFDGYQPTRDSYLKDRAAGKLKYIPTVVIDAYGQNLLQPQPAPPVPGTT
jgi:hypothetical protein